MPTVIADRSDLLGVPTDGCTVNAYKASRFGSPPALNTAPPGAADAGPIISGPANGQTGGVRITVPTIEDYYCSFQGPSGGNLSWGGPYHATSAGGVSSVTAGDTTITVAGTGANPTVAVGTILNAQIGNAAAIAKSKLAALAIVNADVDPAAAIAKSKLATLNIVDADVQAGANIAQSKISGLATSLAGKLSTTGPGAVLATTYYVPLSNTAYTTTSTTAVNIDATNLTITFTAPASTQVMVRLEALAAINVSAQMSWHVMNSGTAIASAYIMQAASAQRCIMDVQVIGLTAGLSYTFTWGWSVVANTGALYAGPSVGVTSYGGALMQVTAS